MYENHYNKITYYAKVLNNRKCYNHICGKNMNYINTVISNTDSLTIAITIVIAIFGWIFSLILQRWNVGHQHRVQIRYDIYKHFIKLHKDIQDKLSKLGAKSHPPFILMSSSMTPFELGLKKEYKGVWMTYSESECLFDGEQKWRSYVNDIIATNSDFSTEYLNLLYLFGDWAEPLKSLSVAKDSLMKEVNLIKSHISNDLNTLQMYSSNHGHDWRTWNQSEIKEIADRISRNSYTIGSYIGDFMALIHNELLAKYFKKKRPIRKTLDPQFKVLTKNGIEERLDQKSIKRINKNKEDMISFSRKQLEKDNPAEHKILLESLIAEVCPFCSNSILVIEVENTPNNHSNFKFGCGDELETSIFT
jgi:hypothetical protein